MSLKERLTRFTVSIEEPMFIAAPFNSENYKTKRYRLTPDAMEKITRLLRTTRFYENEVDELAAVLGLARELCINAGSIGEWLERLYVLGEHPGSIIVADITLTKSGITRAECHYNDVTLWVNADILESVAPNPKYVG